jgi:hypothetical protein
MTILRAGPSAGEADPPAEESTGVEGCKAVAAARTRSLSVRATAGFGGVGSLLFGLGQASEGRLVGRLPVRGSSAVHVRDQADGELLRLAVGRRCSSGGSLGVGGAGGPVMAQPGQEAGAHVLRSREEGGRRAQRCSAGRREAGTRGAARQGEGPAREALLGKAEA